VYQITNWNYTNINIKIPFQYLNTLPSALIAPFSMSLVGDRLVIRYYETYYVYGLKTRAWSTWYTAVPLGPFFKVPQDATTSSPSSYIATGRWKFGSAVQASDQYSFVEGWDETRTEVMNWSLTTKTYDFQAPYSFKRLYLWGVDVISKSTIMGQVFPISYGHTATWNQAAAYTWDQAAGFTWDRFGSPVVSIDDTVVVQGTNNRTFVKMLKSLRYRQINFKVSGTLNNKLSTSPMRIFGITAFVDTKEGVVAKVT
jgi:hypothetical protein